MKHLIIYLKDYKKESILGPLFKLLESSFDLLVPLVMAALIDQGIAVDNKPYIFKMGGVLILFAIAGLAFAATAQFFAATAAVGFSTKLRYALFSHIETLSFNEMDKIGNSTLITRMTSDINQVQSGINLTLRLLLRSPFIVFGAMIMAFTVDVKAALIFVVTIPLLSVVVFGVMAAGMPLYKKVQSGVDKILGRTSENLEGARVIRAFHLENKEEETFRSQNAFLTNLQNMVGRISALTNPITYIIINVAVLAVIWCGGKRVYDGYLTQGQVVALVNYMSQILVELVKLANLIVSITKALACANRIDEVMQTKPSVVDGQGLAAQSAGSGKENGNSGKPALTDDASAESSGQFSKTADYSVIFDHASMKYAGASEESLTDICLQVKRGQTIGIIGGTGSGKTSVVHLIPRFYDVSAGRVLVNGVNVKDYRLKELREKVGMVMQKAVLFSGTIEENLRWGKPDATEEEMWQALEIAQASDVVKSKELGLKSHIEEGGKNLSGGQKQRLTIARAVIRNPEILILDDSASALDFATDARLRAALRNMQGNKTIFIVSQRTSSIQFADQILVLEDGKAVGIGTHAELLEKCEVYREIYESQFRKEGQA